MFKYADLGRCPVPPVDAGRFWIGFGAVVGSSAVSSFLQSSILRRPDVPSWGHMIKGNLWKKGEKNQARACFLIETVSVSLSNRKRTG